MMKHPETNNLISDGMALDMATQQLTFFAFLRINLTEE